ncbi:MAG: hypothetical protein VYA18_21930, partial [Pseudomonadota bacterium]|nr:hypothetical protein [Pseudomonadota bacterium]
FAMVNVRDNGNITKVHEWLQKTERALGDPQLVWKLIMLWIGIRAEFGAFIRGARELCNAMSHLRIDSAS